MALVVNITKKEAGVYFVLLKGSIDSETYQDLDAKLKGIIAQSAKVVVLNMGYVSYISSMGIGVMIKTKKAIEDMRGSFIMTNLQPQIKRVFEVVKALPGMHIFESVEEADDYLDSIQKGEIKWNE